MKHIPRILNSAAVRLFAILDHAVTSLPGSAKPVGQYLPDITQLAICQRFEHGQYELFGCDSHWKTLRKYSCTSVDAAIRIAEKEYPGSVRRWVDPVIASKLPHTTGELPHCAFCNTADPAITELIPGVGACICQECIDRLYHLYRSEESLVRFSPKDGNRKRSYVDDGLVQRSESLS